MRTERQERIKGQYKDNNARIRRLESKIQDMALDMGLSDGTFPDALVSFTVHAKDDRFVWGGNRSVAIEDFAALYANLVELQESLADKLHMDDGLRKLGLGELVEPNLQLQEGATAADIYPDI